VELDHQVPPFIYLHNTIRLYLGVCCQPPGIGGPDEDRSGGFERGGWATPHFDSETATFVNQVYRRADAFLLGRRTYEIFAGSWGAMADPGDNPIAVALNTMPKYVASTTLTDPRWANTTVLSSEVAAAVGD
jgi:dihydrofolate reductase